MQLGPRYGMYPSFDIMASGFATLFGGPGGRCISADAAAAGTQNGGRIDCGAGINGSCTVDCSTPGSVPWFAHYDRLMGTPKTFTFGDDVSEWTTKTWDRPEYGAGL